MEKTEAYGSNKNVQELRSYLTNGIQILRADGRYVLIPKDEIYDALNNYLREGDTKAAEQLISIVESNPEEKDESPFKYTSRSIRISAPVYAALSQKATIIKKPVAHVVGILASNDMKINLNKIVSNGKYDEDRIKNIARQIDEWKNELLKSYNIGLEGETIKRQKEDDARRLSERINAAKTDSEKLTIKYNAEKNVKFYLKNRFDVSENFNYKDEHCIDALPVYENYFYKVNMDLKKSEKEFIKDPFIEDMNTLVDKLNEWLIEVILRRDLPGVSDEARQYFKEKFVKPLRDTDKNETIIGLDFTISLSNSTFDVWRRCDLSDYYYYNKNRNLPQSNDYAKLVDAFIQDYPDDVKIIQDDICKRCGSDIAQNAFFAYCLQMSIALNIKAQLSQDMDHIILEDPLDGSNFEIKYERGSNLLEYMLFPILYEGLSKDIGIPNAVGMKNAWARQYSLRKCQDESSEEYRKIFEEAYNSLGGTWQSGMMRAGDLSELVKLIIMESFACKDYKNAKLFTGYLTDINNIRELSKYIAYYIETTKSMVITLTMPNYLLGLWEIGKGDLTATEYVKKLVQSYGDQLQGQDNQANN